jgi:hypothetical protein
MNCRRILPDCQYQSPSDFSGKTVHNNRFVGAVSLSAVKISTPCYAFEGRDETIDPRCWRTRRGSTGVSPKRRNRPPRLRNRPSPRAQLVEIRTEFRAAITKLKALGCEDSMILVEFWHALDCVNGENCRDF